MDEQKTIDLNEEDVIIAEVCDEGPKESGFKKVWSGIKGFPKKHPKITAALVAVGAGAIGYFTGKALNNRNEEDDFEDESDDNLELLTTNSEDDVDDSDEVEITEF